ncbi:hypothetical protein A1D29_08120 [Pasteurellaceae bacterium Orientalotternb1]|nr:hypothetical protein A1D29_08120 [Pasteurellaceae bacterium Orientalotternb1]
MLKRFFKYLNHRIFYIWLLFFSFLSAMISSEDGTYYTVFAIFIFYYLLLVINDKLFLYVTTFIVITLSLYYPVSLSYGSLNSGIVAALLETNIQESIAFLDKVKLSNLFFPLFFIFCFFILIRLKKYRYTHKRNVDKKQKILHFALFFTFVLSATWVPVKLYLDSQEMVEERKLTLANSPVNILSFYFNIYDSFNDYYDEKKALENAVTLISPWNVISSNPKYKNYILVIGESARRDYLSTYGFKLNTSPFLDKTKGYINRGYVSAAPATYHSLLHTLYFISENQKKIDYSYNIITLAKAANIHTSWISNQGSIGKYDTISSRIGMSSDSAIFTKKAGFNMGNVDDSRLFDILSEELTKQSNNKTNLYVIHLMGSHNKFCDRLMERDEKIAFLNEKMGCYISSILKTDKLLESIIELFQSKQESYSLIYFSDHGLSHIDKEDLTQISLDHGAKYKQNYEVPFVKLSSDDSVRIEVDVKRSAFNFIYGFAQWLGIETEELNKPYDFFSDQEDKNIKVFNFEKMVSFDELEDDPILDIY